MRNYKPGELVDTMKRYGYLLKTKLKYIAMERAQKLEDMGNKITVVERNNVFWVFLNYITDGDMGNKIIVSERNYELMVSK